jgi:hypothetical protein
MGTDVTMLFRHNLKTTDAKIVAQQLHEMCKLPVHYFYEQNYALTQNFELEWTVKETFVPLGNIECDSAIFTINSEQFNKIEINDYNYEGNLLIEKFGLDKRNWPKYEFNIFEEMVEYIGHPWFKINFKHIDDDYKDLHIELYKDGASIYANFDARWWYFNRLFFKLKEYYDVEDTNIITYRKNALEIIKLFGTAEALYSPDQTKGCVIDDDAWHRTWQQSKDVAFALPADKFCHISKYILSGEDDSDENDKSVFVFYDDFADLENI